MSSNNYLAIDTEHGGFLEGRPLTLFEVYMGVYSPDFKLIDELELKLMPDDGICNITAEAMAVNKIDIIKHAKQAIPYKEAKPLVFDLIHKNSDGGASKLIPLGRNVGGDIDIIRREIISRGAWGNHVSYRILDSASVAQFFRAKGLIGPEVKGALGALCKHFGVKLIDAHTAKADAVASAMLIKKMLETEFTKTVYAPYEDT